MKIHGSKTQLDFAITGRHVERAVMSSSKSANDSSRLAFPLRMIFIYEPVD
jgi:hypothetical protein